MINQVADFSQATRGIGLSAFISTGIADDTGLWVGEQFNKLKLPFSLEAFAVVAFQSRWVIIKLVPYKNRVQK